MQSLIKENCTNYDLIYKKLSDRITLKIIKKDGTLEDYDEEKIKKAIKKASERALDALDDTQIDLAAKQILFCLLDLNETEIPVNKIHNVVESVLQKFDKDVAQSYRDYRNYKQDFVHMLDKVYQENQRIMYIGDKENSNIDSTLVSTKRTLVYNELSKELYKKFFLTKEELQAAKDGYIYIHDMSARLNTLNCCLFDVAEVLKGGFEMGNIWYNEPKTLEVAFDVIGDIVMSASAQQYGGFTVPEVDKILEPYAKKSFKKYEEKYISLGVPSGQAKIQAMKDVQQDFEQGFQGWEYKFNTVASSRGDYPFITVTSGLSTTEFGRMCNFAMLKVRKNGQGKKENKKPVLFPKIVFLYDKDLHSEGKPLYDVYKAGVECSKKTMYPDWLSLTGEGYVPSMYKKYKRVVSPMGCVAGNSRLKISTNDLVSDIVDIETFWQSLACTNPVKGQTNEMDCNKIIDLTDQNYAVWDTKLEKYVKIKYIIRNIQDNWVNVTITNGFNITATQDHPFEVEGKGIVHGIDLRIGDRILTANGINLVSKLEYFTAPDYAYDLTTESEHFEVNGIYSHNCRAFLSPWYEKGGEKPIDENDKPIFVGRFNIGAVSLHLPMILAKSRQEGKDFYEVLDYYMELIRNLHKRTYDYLGELKASTNPLAYCEGGFYGGHLNYTDKIKPLLKAATASFGITALNELQQLYNKKSLVEDGQFALEVMQHIIDKVNEFKAEDHKLYALYGTPAESLCLCGDEVVQCYGGNKKIRDIKVGDLVYTYNDELKEIQLKPVLASTKTKENAVVVKVTTDNGQEFICTPEHPFGIRKMMKNEETGRFIREEVSFVSAKHLKPGMRLKSNYIREDMTTHRITFSCGNINLRYQVHGKYLYGDYRPKYEIHHIDHSKNNDNFENLQKLTVKEHRQHHYNLQEHQFTHENKGEKNHFYGKHHTAESNTKNRLWHIYDGVERFSLTGEHLEHFDCMEDASRKGYVRNSVSLCCKKKYEHGGETKNIYKDSYWFFTKDCQEMLEANHKVVKVEFLDKLEDVYNIEVADNNNFFIGDNDGVLVHNCGLQVEQFRKKYGIVENVSDRLYVSNSFHCHVTEDITPIEKQDLEKRFWDTMNGGKIQYVRYPIDYNTKAVDTLIRRAMDMGFYEGVNLELSYCDDCGHQELDMDVCPVCGSSNLTKISRMNGYLSYSRVKGDSRLNDAKMAEIKDRRSM